jgi:hypothetical protein
MIGGLVEEGGFLGGRFQELLVLGIEVLLVDVLFSLKVPFQPVGRL